MLGADGYKTKKELKASVGAPLRVVETSMFGLEFKANGKNTLVGPCAYTKRSWYAEVQCKDGLIISVK